MASQALRVAVCDGDRRSATWRFWFGPRDAYVATRAGAHEHKVSIHYPRAGLPAILRYVGWTREGALRRGMPADISRAQRTHAVWRGHQFAPGYYIEYRIRFLPEELRSFNEPDEESIYWLAAPRAGRATEIALLSAPISHEGPCPTPSDGTEVEVLHDVRLPGLRRLWIVALEIPAPTKGWLEGVRALASQELREDLKAQSPSPSLRVMVHLLQDDGCACYVDLAADSILASA